MDSTNRKGPVRVIWQAYMSKHLDILFLPDYNVDTMLDITRDEFPV